MVYDPFYSRSLVSIFFFKFDLTSSFFARQVVELWLDTYKMWKLAQRSTIVLELLILRCRNTTEGKIGMEWQQPSLVINLELIICSLIYWETHEHYKLSVKNWLLQIRATIIMHYVCSLLLFHCGLTFLFLSKTCEDFLT